MILEQRIIKLNQINIGGINYYGIDKYKGIVQQLDKAKVKNLYMKTMEKAYNKI